MMTKRHRLSIQAYCVERALNKLPSAQRGELKAIYESAPSLFPKAQLKASGRAREWAQDHQADDVAYHVGLVIAWACMGEHELMRIVEHMAVACGYEAGRLHDTYDSGVHLKAKADALQDVLQRVLA